MEDDVRPLVTIVITTFKRAALLPPALASAVTQTYRPLDILVVNEPTPGDSARAIVDEFVKNHPDAPVRYTEILGKGISAARNDGARKAKGDYIVFLDDDDELLPDYAASLVRAFADSGKNVGTVGAQPLLVDVAGKTSQGAISVEPLWSCVVGNGWMFRSEVFSKDGGIWFDETFTGDEDWDFSLRFFVRYTARVVDKTLWRHEINLPKFFEKTARSLSSDRAKAYSRFEKFLARHYKAFQLAGAPAITLVNFLAGVKAGEAGEMSAARTHFYISWRAQFSLQAFAYWLAALTGYYGFMFFHVAKSRIMRAVKTITSPVARK